MLLIKEANLFGNITDILCQGGKIIEIGNINYKLLKDIFKTQEIEIVYANNMKIIPSYIDNHVHIIGGGGENGFSSRIPEIDVNSILKYGVTTVVGVLGTDTTTKSVDTLVAKTKALNEEGITAYCLTGGYEFPSPTLTGRIQKDIAFINEIIGLKTAISDHRCYNPNTDDLIKLISEVRVAALISNKPGIVNIHIGYGKGNMDKLLNIIEETNIPIKHIFPTHVSKTDEIMEQAIKMTNMGGYVDVTANKSAEELADKIKYMSTKGNESLITISSDANGSCPIWENSVYNGMTISNMSGIHQLIKYLIINCNYSIEKAISFATANPATLLQLNKKGKIDLNYDADLLLLDDDYEIDTVISKGKIRVKRR